MRLTLTRGDLFSFWKETMPTFQGQADKEEFFALPSAILEATWREPEGFDPDTRTLEVRTAFVADGSPIKVACMARDGSVVERVEGKVYGGLFRKLLKPARKPLGGLAFEAMLPEHGLKAYSGFPE